MSSPALPRNLYALLRKLFAWAVERGDIDRSPFEQMRSPKAVASRDRVLNDAELALIAVFAGELNAPFDAYARLLIVTGQRRDEVSGMRWEELSQEAATWTIPGSRTKNGQVHVVPLGSIAQIELNSLATKGKWPSSGLVFTTTGTTPISGYSKAKRQLDDSIAQAAGRRLAAWRFHDLRRTFATNMQRLGVRFEVTEALLNHVGGAKSGIAAVYQRHDWAPEKIEAINLWEAHLRSIVESAGSAPAR
ncbi:site-specific integrase [Sphingomonas mucosissima]|nr:site-specific integrase [Sphingomonas mucosissima]